MLHRFNEFQASLKKYAPIPPGAPDDYVPASGKS